MGCQQQASEIDNPFYQINAQSQTALWYTPKEYSVFQEGLYFLKTLFIDACFTSANTVYYCFQRLLADALNAELVREHQKAVTRA